VGKLRWNLGCSYLIGEGGELLQQISSSWDQEAGIRPSRSQHLVDSRVLFEPNNKVYHSPLSSQSQLNIVLCWFVGMC